MLGKALSLAVVAALVGAGAVQASTLSRVWLGKTAKGGDVSFARAGKRMHNVRINIDVPCTNDVEGTQRNSPEQLWFDKVLTIGAGGRMHTTQRSSDAHETWTLTLDGTLGATKARGRVAWTYQGTSAGGWSCRGKGSLRWTAKRGRPVADEF